MMDNSGNRIKGQPIPELLLNKLDSYVFNIARCNITDTSLDDMINQQPDGYIRGQKTAEQTAKTIDEKISLFLNE